MSRAAYLHPDELAHILYYMQPYNRVICVTRLSTGYRVSDILELKRSDIDQCRKNNYWLSLTEQKTGKVRKVHITRRLCELLESVAGVEYIFPHRLKENSHRTRQAVYKDFKRAVRRSLGYDTEVSVHSLRKTYAVEKYRSSGSLGRVQHDLNHSSAATTLLYALADKL